MADDTTAHVEGEPRFDGSTPQATWPLYEVFVRGKRCLLYTSDAADE